MLQPKKKKKKGNTPSLFWSFLFALKKCIVKLDRQDQTI